MTHHPSGDQQAERVARLARSAQPLLRRLGNPDTLPAAAKPGLQAAPHLLHWQRLLNQASEQGFRQRLQLANSDVSQAAAALTQPAGVPASWAASLQQMLADSTSCQSMPPAGLAPHAKVLLTPFIAFAERHGAGGPAARDTPDPLLGDSVAHLWRQLAALAASGLTTPDSESPAPTASWILTELENTPVLARRLTETTRTWIDNYRALRDALDADQTALADLLPRACAPQRPRALTPGLSDPHKGGRQVTRIELNAGVVYHKPRSAGMDQAWQQLLDWLQTQTDLPDLKHPATLDRGSHSWSLAVTHHPCETPAQIAQFYQRCGTLLCLLYLLRGGDLISDNLIASGAWPYLIDAECLLSPPPLLRPPESDEATPPAMQELVDSVAGTLMLPLPWNTGDGEPTELSALTTSTALADASQHGSPRRLAHMPWLQDEPIAADLHADAIVDGFTRTYRCLLAARQQYADSLPEPLLAFRQQTVRYIPRPTMLYQQLLARASQPECLRDAARRGLVFEYLAKLHMQQPDPARLWPLFEAEVVALEVGDIPYFEVPAGSRDLLLNGKPLVRDAFETSPFSRVVERWRRLSEHDLQRQCGVIRRLLAAAS